MMEHELRSTLLETAKAFAVANGCGLSGVARRCRNDSNFFKRISDPTNTFTARTFDEVMGWFAAEWPSGKERPFQLMKWAIDMKGLFVTTRVQDGTVIARDPETGIAVSGATPFEALAELRRLTEAKKASA